MATTHTFSVRKVRGAEPEEKSVPKPDGLDDIETWADRIEAGSEQDLKDRISELAFQQWVVKAQNAYRTSDTEPDEYKYGARVSRGPSKAVIDAETFPWPEDENLAVEQFMFFERSEKYRLTNTDAFPYDL